MDAVAVRVLARYPSPLRGALEALRNRGGFSGARLWRLRAPGGPLCLRAGAPAESGEQLRARHRLMRVARDSGLGFVPRVMETASGDSVVEAGGRAWELMEWMPGRADFRERPSAARLRAAARALARVHLAWETHGGGYCCPCPAVRRRLEALALPEPLPDGRGSDLLLRLRAAADRWLARVPEMLRPAHVRCRVQPCLRDVWHDHLLYDGEELTGLVDYAAVAQDSVAADVARMLGSLVGDGGWEVALAAYREVRPFSEEEERLAQILDRTGVILALANWLRWLSEPGRTFEDRAHVGRRVEELLARVGRWPNEWCVAAAL